MLISVRELFGIAGVGIGGCIVLLKAYFDESRQTDGPVCVMAGFVGTQTQWESFEEDWLRALKPRKSLHLSKLRWNTKPRRLQRLLDRMGAVPDRHGLIRIASSVRRKDYLELAHGTLAEDAMSPYMGCFQYCLKAALESMSSSQRLHVFLERQDTYSPLVGVFNEEVFIERSSDKRLVGITYLAKDNCVAFQPADYLAFHLSTAGADKNDPKAIATKPIMGNGLGVGWNMTREEMSNTVESIKTRHISRKLGDALMDPSGGISVKEKK